LYAVINPKKRHIAGIDTEALKMALLWFLDEQLEIAKILLDSFGSMRTVRYVAKLTRQRRRVESWSLKQADTSLARLWRWSPRLYGHIVDLANECHAELSQAIWGASER
jgi:hypothetical protein